MGVGGCGEGGGGVEECTPNKTLKSACKTACHLLWMMRRFNHTQPCGCIDEMNLTLGIILQAVAKQALPLDPVGCRGKLDLPHSAESVGQALEKYVISIWPGREASTPTYKVTCKNVCHLYRASARHSMGHDPKACAISRAHPPQEEGRVVPLTH